VSFAGAPRILIAAGEATERHRLVDYLAEHQMSIVSASGRKGVMRQFAASDPQLVILDLQIDFNRGLDLLREIRSRSDVPVIILTDDTCDETAAVLGLELGADDYLRRPFGLREILARIRAILRRRPRSSASRRSAGGGNCTFGGWRLDRQFRRLFNPRGELVTLTKGEYALLLAFIRAPQRLLSRRYLLEATHHFEDVHDRSINVQIFRLRRKLKSDPKAPRLITTERGLGYMFVVPVKELKGRATFRAP
jgi:two-component system OmpR family response regulator